MLMLILFSLALRHPVPRVPRDVGPAHMAPPHILFPRKHH